MWWTLDELLHKSLKAFKTNPFQRAAHRPIHNFPRWASSNVYCSKLICLFERSISKWKCKELIIHGWFHRWNEFTECLIKWKGWRHGALAFVSDFMIMKTKLTTFRIRFSILFFGCFRRHLNLALDSCQFQGSFSCLNIFSRLQIFLFRS